MTPRDHENIDALIEDALRSEPMRPVPLTLHRRVEERVRIAALKDRERARFRFSLTSTLVALLTVIGLAGFVLVVTNLGPLLNNGVPGASGIRDWYTARMLQTWTEYTGSYSLVTSVLMAAGTLGLAVWVPLRYFRRTH
jgi:hypothetical protein